MRLECVNGVAAVVGQVEVKVRMALLEHPVEPLHVAMHITQHLWAHEPRGMWPKLLPWRLCRMGA